MYNPILMDVLAREHERELSSARHLSTLMRQAQGKAAGISVRSLQHSLVQVALDSVRHALRALHGTASA